MNHQEALLKAEHLSISIADTLIVNAFSLEVKPRELVCLVGRSGSGKSTIFHALAGLTCPQEGAVTLAGQDITGKPGNVSYMLQKDLLLPNLKTWENVALPLLVTGVSKERAQATAKSLLEEFGLLQIAQAWPYELSGGMRQRVAFLRTFIQHKDCMLLDEPFSALDAITRSDIRWWFLSLLDRRKASCIMVTHDVDEAVVMADRICILAGKPQQGVPGHKVCEIQVDVPRQNRKEFSLSRQFLDIKREVLVHL